MGSNAKSDDCEEEDSTLEDAVAWIEVFAAISGVPLFAWLGTKLRKRYCYQQGDGPPVNDGPGAAAPNPIHEGDTARNT